MEKKEETEAKNSSTSSGQHDRSVMPAIFYFTTVPVCTCLDIFPSTVSIFLSPLASFQNARTTVWQLCHVDVSQPTHAG